MSFVPKFRCEKKLYVILSFTIILTAIGMEWLYKALEQYTYITVRSVIFKFIALIAMFLLIHEQEDYVVYEVKLDVDSLVSMNMWGLTPDFLKTLEEGFKEFFEKEVPANPLKAEYLIPTFIGELLSEGKMSVKVLRTNDTWYGMTYKEDVVAVKESFSKMLEDGTYKGDLFSDL